MYGALRMTASSLHLSGHYSLCCVLSRAEAALHRGLEGLVWRDDATDAYIRDTLELVRDLDSVLTTLKENVAQIMELLKTFESNHMFDRKVSRIPFPA